jgi:CheY-like chemotaxis protein
VSQSRPLVELFGVSDDTRLNAEYINSLLEEIGTQLAGLQVLKEGLDVAIAQAQDLALERVNEILTPATDAVTLALDAVNVEVAAAQAILTDLQTSGVSISQVDGLQDALDLKNSVSTFEAEKKLTRARIFGAAS